MKAASLSGTSGSGKCARRRDRSQKGIRRHLTLSSSGHRPRGRCGSPSTPCRRVRRVGPPPPVKIPLGVAAGVGAVVTRIISWLEALHRGPSKARRPSIRFPQGAGPAGPQGESSAGDRSDLRRRRGQQAAEGIDQRAVDRKVVPAHLPADIGVVDHAGRSSGPPHSST